MTKKVEPGESPDLSNDNEFSHRAKEIHNAGNDKDQPLVAVKSLQIKVVVHHSNKTEGERAAIQLIQKYFVERKGSTQHYLAKFISESGQTIDKFDAFMYTNEYNLFFRRTVEEAYADGLYWQQKITGFIRVWRADDVENYACAANFNMVGKFRRKKHSGPDLVPQEIKDEAIRQLKILLLTQE